MMDKQNITDPYCEYHLALKTKEVLTRYNSWMNLADAVLSEISRRKRTNAV